MSLEEKIEALKEDIKDLKKRAVSHKLMMLKFLKFCFDMQFIVWTCISISWLMPLMKL